MSRFGSVNTIVRSPFSDVQQPSGNVLDTIYEHFGTYGSATAIECSETGRSYAYKQLQEAVEKWAGFLTNVGVNKGDVIAIYLNNCPEYPIVVLGALSIGVVITPVDTFYDTEQLATQLNETNPKVLVTIPAFESNVKSYLEQEKSTLKVVMNGSSETFADLNLLDILKDPMIRKVETVELSNEELAVIVYTSGTAGPPKAVALSHGAYSISIRMFTHPSVFCGNFATRESRNTYVCILPFYTAFTLLAKLMVGLYTGAKLVTIPAFDPNLYIKALKKYKGDVLHLVPPLIDYMVKSPEVTRETLSSGRKIFVGATPLTPCEASAFKAKFSHDIAIHEGYGTVEVLMSNTVAVGRSRIGSGGQLLPNVSAKIISTDTGADLHPCQMGELCLKTPAMMNGYYQNERETSLVIDKDGWFHTGDVGFFDADGFLVVTEKVKDLIKVDGLQISPSEIENTIRKHPSVLHVGVVGVPHSRLGEVPRAFVITREDVSDKDILRFVEEKLEPHKRLSGGVTFVKELPIRPNGKIRRRELRKMDFK